MPRKKKQLKPEAKPLLEPKPKPSALQLRSNEAVAELDKAIRLAKIYIEDGAFLTGAAYLAKAAGLAIDIYSYRGLLLVGKRIEESKTKVPR